MLTDQICEVDKNKSTLLAVSEYICCRGSDCSFFQSMCFIDLIRPQIIFIYEPCVEVVKLIRARNNFSELILSKRLNGEIKSVARQINTAKYYEKAPGFVTATICQ